jgi:hypothetical protein
MNPDGPKRKGRRARRVFIGNWTLPSGNNCHVFLKKMPKPGEVAVGGLECLWDIPPSPAWPQHDIDHWEQVTFPEIMRALAVHMGRGTVLGLRL